MTFSNPLLAAVDVIVAEVFTETPIE